MDESPQILRRWGHYRRTSTTREKDDWMLDFARAEAAAPPLPPPPEPFLVPPPKAPEQAPLPDRAQVFATLRTKLGNL